MQDHMMLLMLRIWGRDINSGAMMDCRDCEVVPVGLDGCVYLGSDAICS
jgi:hypothetical protein